MLRDFVGMMRKLWKGEKVMGYDGPLASPGSFPYLHMADWLDEDIPLMLGAYGPKSLELAGSLFGAEMAGRDPASVKVWTMVATVCDPDEERRLRSIVGRMATYLQAPDLAELLVNINGWEMSMLEKFRAAPVVANMTGGIDSVATLDQLREIETLIPKEWFPAAVGDAATCAQRWADQFKAGADGVIIHASTPTQFERILPAYEAIRDAKRFASRTNRPC